jgi:hypothetical protein
VQVLKARWEKYSDHQCSVSLPKRIVQSDDGRYFQDALNISANLLDEADLTLDLFTYCSWPLNGLSRWGQTLSIGAKQLLQIVMRHVPETNSDWQRLLNNAMYLLEDDGHLIFE